MTRLDPDRQRTRTQRYRLVAEIEAMLDGPATFLAVVFAIVLVVELVLGAQDAEVPPVLGWIQLAIWGVFIVHFLLGITISPDRVRYLRRNWLTAISLAIPFLRAFRVLRAVRLLRATNSLRVVAGFNRIARSLRGILAWTRAGYAAALAVTSALLGSAAMLMFESGAAESQITDYGEALWWAAATLTTVGAASEPVTIGGRIVALFLMFGGLVLLGYVAGVVAAVLFGPGHGLGARAVTRPDR
jgi:voltage-gated potassium channel